MSTLPRSDAPVVETTRLVLRGHVPDDLPDVAALWGDPAVTRYIGGRPSTLEETWSRLLRYVGHWSALGYGYWVVVERASGRFVGEVGLADFRRAIVPSLGGAPEAGWVLAPSAHGRGYATEAVRAAIAWYEGRFGPTRTVCIIDPAHDASLRVAARCGFRRLARTTYHGEPTMVLERPATAG